MIKVGQIYYHNRINKKLVITYVDIQDKKLCSWVTEEGKVCDDKISWVLSICSLLAEYPTWQEAVNSKEFRDELQS